MSIPASTDQAVWAERLRALPGQVRAILEPLDDRTLRARPAPGEWSAIEVLGHLVDKLRVWCGRLERILGEEQPFLPGYDQDAYVREHDYQAADRAGLLAALTRSAEHFAQVVEDLSDAALDRVGVHGESGPITARACVELPTTSAFEHLAQMQAAIAAAGA